MTRRDFVSFEQFYANTLRREAKSRAHRYPKVAEQLDRWAEAADRRVEAIRCGPLFDDASRVREGEAA